MENAPDDILRLIFHIYVHEAKCTPTALLPVCRRWQDILLSTPTLWTRVVLHICRSSTIRCITNRGENGQLSPLSTFIHRSRTTNESEGLSLDIFIIWSHLPGDKVEWEFENRSYQFDWTEKLLASIEDPERWRSLFISLLTSSTNGQKQLLSIDILKNGGHTTLPRLQNLRLRNVFFDNASITLPAVSTISLQGSEFKKFPSIKTLENLRIYDYPLNRNPENGIAWEVCPNLKKISVDSVNLLPTQLDHYFPKLNTLNLDVPDLAIPRLVRHGTVRPLNATSHSLYALEIAPISLTEAISNLNLLPNIHFKVLRLSCQHMKNTYGADWRWDWEKEQGDTDERDWNPRPEVLLECKKIFEKAKAIGVRVEGMEPQMEEVLQKARVTTDMEIAAMVQAQKDADEVQFARWKSGVFIEEEKVPDEAPIIKD